VGFRIVAKALNADGSLVSDYIGTVAFTSTDSQAQLPQAYTFGSLDAGCHEFTATVFTDAGQTISAIAVSPSGDTLTSRVQLTVGPRPQFVYIDGTPDDYVQDFDFFSPTSGWAVGITSTAERPLVARLSGSSWSRVDVPVLTPPPNSGMSIGLAAPGAGWMDSTAGGTPGGPGYRYQLVNGVWTVPQLSLTEGPFSRQGLTMVTPQDGWEAVYRSDVGMCSVDHYDGMSWSTFQDISPDGGVDHFRFPKGQPGEGWALGGDAHPWRLLGGAWSPDPTYPLDELHDRRVGDFCRDRRALRRYELDSSAPAA
jgi:hypothetical protein